MHRPGSRRDAVVRVVVVRGIARPVADRGVIATAVADRRIGRTSSVGCRHFLLQPFGHVRFYVLAKVVLAVESFPAVAADLRFHAAVDDEMQIQMLLPLEALHAHAADVRPLRIVAQLVPLQVFLPLQARSADIADEPPLDLVYHQVLLKALFLRVGHVALRTTEQDRPVDGRRDMHLSRFLPFRLRRFRFVLSLFPGLAGSGWRTVFTRRAGR